MTRSFILANFLSNWWSMLDLSRQVFYGIAFLAACIVVVMGIFSISGIAHDVEVDAHDADSGGSLFSLKPVTGFLFAFGWAGAAARGCGLSLPISCLLAILAGVGVMLAIAALLRASQKLKVDGSIKKTDAIGKIATVYVTIPPSGQSGGQITVPLDGRTITLAALQNGAAPIPADAKVKVLELIDSSTARIESI